MIERRNVIAKSECESQRTRWHAHSWRGPLKLEGPAGGEEQHGHGRRRARMEVCARDDFGFTALHYAAQSGLAKCIEYLLAHGANAFAETRDLTMLNGSIEQKVLYHRESLYSLYIVIYSHALCLMKTHHIFFAS